MEKPRFQWDESKRLSNFEKHGVDFVDVRELFDGRHLFIVPSHEKGELRFAGTGEIDGRFYTVIWTPRGDAIRIISARRAAVRRDGDIVTYTSDELEEMRRRGESMTDWARIDVMSDDELEASIDHDDEGEFDLSKGFLGVPPITVRTTLLLGLDILHWFKSQGPDYEARINAVLRSYIDTQNEKAASAAD